MIPSLIAAACLLTGYFAGRAHGIHSEQTKRPRCTGARGYGSDRCEARASRLCIDEMCAEHCRHTHGYDGCQREARGTA